jgi:hypothetical protein
VQLSNATNGALIGPNSVLTVSITGGTPVGAPASGGGGGGALDGFMLALLGVLSWLRRRAPLDARVAAELSTRLRSDPRGAQLAWSNQTSIPAACSASHTRRVASRRHRARRSSGIGPQPARLSRELTVGLTIRSLGARGYDDGFGPTVGCWKITMDQ